MASLPWWGEIANSKKLINFDQMVFKLLLLIHVTYSLLMLTEFKKPRIIALRKRINAIGRDWRGSERFGGEGIGLDGTGRDQRRFKEIGKS